MPKPPVLLLAEDLAVVRAHGAALYSRNGTDLTARFQGVAAAAALPPGTLINGELVVLDGNGCPDFAALMRRRGVRSGQRQFFTSD